jgi:squalene-associated FAD-dependent desaturase
MSRTIHIVGAGLAGLSAAVRLAQTSATVVVHEATRVAGGRCRSYADTATGLIIDNGNHLLLSGNRAALEYLRTIGSGAHLVGPAGADFPFVDLANGERWTVRINDGRIPWWIFDSGRRVPGTSPRDYLAIAPLLWTSAVKTVCEVLPCSGPLYERLTHPLLLAALNIDPCEGTAALAGAIVRETLAAGGKACRPLVARDGLGPAFIEPALEFLRQRGTVVRFEHELRGMAMEAGRVTSLDFGSDKIAAGQDDIVIVAVPAYAAKPLIPGLDPPSTFRAIVNAHFRVEPPADFPPMLGVVNGTVEWIFAFPNRLSVTISAADRLMDTPREALARTIWGEVSRIAGLPDELPPWQVVRERRATFAATPAENAKRPPAQTSWRNLFLAGDWTATGLPATIEGAIRSGHRAAQCVMQSKAS